jgi:TatD DNase family protein
MELTDIGLNLTSNKFKDIKKILEDAKEANVSTVILTGTCVRTSNDSVKLCEDFDTKYGVKMYCTCGIHPHDAKSSTIITMNIIENLASNKTVIAIGETGLDFNRFFSSKDEQIESFISHIELAIKLNKPLFLHERDAHKEFVEILSPYKDKVKCVVHCFTGTSAELKEYLELGFYIGITGWIADKRRNTNLILAIKENKEKLIDRVMIETDAPFLNPINPRELNYPKLLPNVLKELSKHIEIDEIELNKKINENIKIFFNI